MADHTPTLIALSLAATFVLAAILGRRGGDERRDLRLMLGTGAACGGLALLLFSLSATT